METERHDGEGKVEQKESQSDAPPRREELPSQGEPPGEVASEGEPPEGEGGVIRESDQGVGGQFE